LVGSILRWTGFSGRIIGDLDNPVHAENLDSTLAMLRGHRGTVLGVDACLGTKSEVGSVMVRPGPLRPGLGVKKKLAPVGDLYIAGVVNVGGFMEYMVLQNTRLSLVMKMAQAISSGIHRAEAILQRAGCGEEPGPSEDRAAIPADLVSDGHHELLLRAFARQR
jgi:putative sporulation protein YyaC